MIKMSELPNKDFKVAIIKMVQQAIISTLETNEKRNLSQKESKRNLQLKNTTTEQRDRRKNQQLN